MTFSITGEHKRSFDLATMRHEAETFRLPADWQQNNEIKARYAHEMKKLEKQYYAGYEHKMAKVTKILIDKAGARNRTFTHRWFGADNFNKDHIRRQAHKLVHHDYLQRVDQLERAETKELGELIGQVKQRDILREKPLTDFERATNRRDGEERRITQQQTRPRPR